MAFSWGDADLDRIESEVHGCSGQEALCYALAHVTEEYNLPAGFGVDHALEMALITRRDAKEVLATLNRTVYESSGHTIFYYLMVMSARPGVCQISPFSQSNTPWSVLIWGMGVGGSLWRLLIGSVKV